jgi:hypothetical protein
LLQRPVAVELPEAVSRQVDASLDGFDSLGLQFARDLLERLVGKPTQLAVRVNHAMRGDACVVGVLAEKLPHPACGDRIAQCLGQRAEGGHAAAGNLAEQLKQLGGQVGQRRKHPVSQAFQRDLGILAASTLRAPFATPGRPALGGPAFRGRG